ncbi:MAG TPA: hypothetical protein VMH20_02970 [Verrucomicrobiae bacterium]|jgi:hypothetical protein|nr:hypothetical protein [Verrucomicrobiae bacterium]
MTRRLFILFLVSLSGVSAQTSSPTQAPSPTHTIRFTFNYDFAITPACSNKVKVVCVQQFNFYDISQGADKRVKLGSMPAKPGAKKLEKNISGTSDPQVFNSGRHRVAVAALLSDGRESDVRQCSVVLTIP